mmetsp:Transcript_25471/g.33171  ORF Transcript_25471/g.33171 Transcript_25471/m.33171 type:complete len:356 (+) Transcript_25471:71-1138(+)
MTASRGIDFTNFSGNKLIDYSMGSKVRTSLVDYSDSDSDSNDQLISSLFNEKEVNMIGSESADAADATHNYFEQKATFEVKKMNSIIRYQEAKDRNMNNNWPLPLNKAEAIDQTELLNLEGTNKFILISRIMTYHEIHKKRFETLRSCEDHVAMACPFENCKFNCKVNWCYKRGRGPENCFRITQFEPHSCSIEVDGNTYKPNKVLKPSSKKLKAEDKETNVKRQYLLFNPSAYTANALVPILLHCSTSVASSSSSPAQSSFSGSSSHDEIIDKNDEGTSNLGIQEDTQNITKGSPFPPSRTSCDKSLKKCDKSCPLCSLKTKEALKLLTNYMVIEPKPMFVAKVLKLAKSYHQS